MFVGQNTLLRSAGISCKGKTNIVIFEGLMNAAGFIEVLETGLLPYMREVDENARLMQYNDPKHAGIQCISLTLLYYYRLHVVGFESGWRTTMSTGATRLKPN